MSSTATTTTTTEPSSVLVVGATGQTGKWLCQHLLKDGHKVTAVVRSKDGLPQEVRTHPNITVVEHQDPLKMPDAEWKKHLTGVDSVASCLGHNLSFKGMFLPPFLLCHDTAKKTIGIMNEINNETGRRSKFVLMNTVGSFNNDLKGKGETSTWGQWALTGALRWTLPPFNDNEQAMNFLRLEVGKPGSKFPTVDWTVVRPDDLIDNATLSGMKKKQRELKTDAGDRSSSTGDTASIDNQIEFAENIVTETTVHASPTRNWITNAGTTTRINCAWFMKDLMTNETLFNQWKFQMPCVYNKED